MDLAIRTNHRAVISKGRHIYGDQFREHLYVQVDMARDPAIQGGETPDTIPFVGVLQPVQPQQSRCDYVTDLSALRSGKSLTPRRCSDACNGADHQSESGASSVGGAGPVGPEQPWAFPSPRSSVCVCFLGKEDAKRKS